MTTGRTGADFSTVPLNLLLGLELRGCSPDGATVVLPPQSSVAQEYGVVHGGILAALADTAAVYALYPSLGDEERMTSIEFKVNFLSAAAPDRGEIVAQSSVIRKGRSIAVLRVDVRQEEQLVLTGIFTYFIVPAKRPA